MVEGLPEADGAIGAMVESGTGLQSYSGARRRGELSRNDQVGASKLLTQSLCSNLERHRCAQGSASCGSWCWLLSRTAAKS
jgi:hypothetical protein